MKVIKYFLLIVILSVSNISYAKNQCEQIFSKKHDEFITMLGGMKSTEDRNYLVGEFKKCMSNSPKSCSIQTYSKSLMRGPTVWSVHSYSVEDLVKMKWSRNTSYLIHTISSNDKCLIAKDNSFHLYPWSIYAIKGGKVIDVVEDPVYVDVPLGFPGTIKDLYDKINPDYK